MSTKGTKAQIGSNADPAKNVVLETLADGTLVIRAGSLLTPGAVIAKLAALPSMIRVTSSNGYGSTNTAIRRWFAVTESQGTDITLTQSATLGDSFTINTSGVYSVSYTDGYTAAAGHFGISLNSNQLSANIASINVAHRLAAGTTGTGSYNGCVSVTKYFAAGDVIRAHSDVANGNSTGACSLTIQKVT